MDFYAKFLLLSGGYIRLYGSQGFRIGRLKGVKGEECYQDQNYPRETIYESEMNITLEIHSPGIYQLRVVL